MDKEEIREGKRFLIIGILVYLSLDVTFKFSQSLWLNQGFWWILLLLSIFGMVSIVFGIASIIEGWISDEKTEKSEQPEEGEKQSYT